MKVKVDFIHAFHVTREVEIDEEEFDYWVSMNNIGPIPRDEALTKYLNDLDSEDLAEIWSDWRLDKPLPNDFELWDSRATEAEEIDG